MFTTKRCSKVTVFKSQSFYKPFILSSDSDYPIKILKNLWVLEELRWIMQLFKGGYLSLAHY